MESGSEELASDGEEDRMLDVSEHTHSLVTVSSIISGSRTGPLGASLVVQWLRICLLMQRTRVRALVWEDPTCRRATRPVSHNY